MPVPSPQPEIPVTGYLEQGRHRLRYLEAGEGSPVILIHGAITTADEMAIALFDDLTPRHRVVAFDRPGHGGSTRARFGGEPLDQARRIRAGVQTLGIERPILVSHSFGTVVALSYAMEWPEAVAGLVMISPLLLPEARLEHLLFGPRAAPLTGDFVAHGPGRAQDAALLPLLWEMMFKPQPMPREFRERFPFDLANNAEGMQAMGEDSVQAVGRLTLNFSRLAACRVPTHIFVGAADLVVDPMKHGAIAAAAMPRSRFRVLPGMGHMLHHFHPALIAGAVEDLRAEA